MRSANLLQRCARSHWLKWWRTAISFESEGRYEGFMVVLYLFDETALKIALRENDNQSLCVGLYTLITMRKPSRASRKSDVPF